MTLISICWLIAPAVLFSAEPNYTVFVPDSRTWTIGNEQVEAAFRLEADGRFRHLSLRDKSNGHVWEPAGAEASSLLTLTVNGQPLDHTTQFELRSHEAADVDRGGTRLTIQLVPLSMPAEARVEIEVYAGQPFIRHRAFLRNNGGPMLVTGADMLPWHFQAPEGVVRAFFVGQWSWGGERSNFEPHEVELNSLEGPVEAFTGAYGDHSTWGAIRDEKDNGLMLGWEFNGRARAHAELDRSSRVLRLDADIQRLAHLLNAGEEFAVPGAFIGVFRGDWDEAGYRTQRFVEAALAKQLPNGESRRFPYVAFDSWGYQWDINEQVLMDAAKQAAYLGVELFTVDFGWAEVTGDWTPDPVKFPNGLRPLSDYVHSLGMKFGLHLPFGEAMETSRILRQNPDWAVVSNPGQQRGYFGAVGVCLSHRPAREWVIGEILRLVREYNVDWLLQDGENMVKGCLARNHTHRPDDGNYSNAVEGLDEIIRKVQEQAPELMWENCEDGGNMQTYKMVQQYVTSIVNDNADFLITRKSVYGATYPFPPRYTDRYMEVSPWDNYRTRSHFFGGPLIIMDSITRWPEWMTDFMKKEIEIYKALRGHISEGKVFHLSPPPDGAINDHLQSHHLATGKSVIFVFRQETAYDHEVVRPRGLAAERTYRVRFQDSDRTYTSTGRQIMDEGIIVELPTQFFAEILYIDPL